MFPAQEVPEFGVSEHTTQIHCELLGEFGSFGWWLQGVLAFCCMLSLVGKRFTDKVRRPWKIWWFDTSKQGVQATLNHSVNIALSKAFGVWLEDDTDPCNWYWVNLSLDCTLGVGILFVLLRILQRFYRSKSVGRPELAQCGEYGDPPDFRIFVRQLLDWQALVVIQKIALTTLVVYFRAELALAAGLMLGWLSPYPRVKLVVVMVIGPLTLTVFALWAADSFLQAAPSSTEVDGPEASDDETNKLSSFQEWKQRAATVGRQSLGLPGPSFRI